MAQFRQGLPRVPGGEPWPPSTLVLAVKAAEPSHIAEAPVPVDVATGTTTAVAPPQATAVGFRRGLPRTAGGEPWPPAGAEPQFAVAAPVAGLQVDGPEPTAVAAAVPVVAEAAVPPAKTPAPAPTSAAPAPAPSAPAPRRRLTPKGVLVGLGVLVVVAAIILATRWFLFGTGAGAAFLRSYPGKTPLPSWAPVGQPLWLQWQHWLNAFFLILIIKTGWTVRRTTRPAATWQSRRSGSKRISIELFTHLLLDVVWVANGVVFWILLLATGQFIRIVPSSWNVIPNAISAALQYVSLSWPTEDGWANYNSLQVLAYFLTVFIAAPLALLSGLRLSPVWPSAAPRLNRAYPVEVARKIHFPVMVYFVLFVIVHVVLVFATGALRNLNHMYWGSDDPSSWAGFLVFVLGLLVTVAGWLAVAPRFMKYLGAGLGKVGR